MPDDPVIPGRYSRHSHGLEQFCSHIGNEPGLSVLDLAAINQLNVSFIAGLGHKLYTEDFLYAVKESFGDSSAGMHSHRPVEEFFRSNLDFPEGLFDGVLVWDILEFLPADILTETVDRLFKVVKPGSPLLCFFHAEEKATEVLTHSYRIEDSSTLLLVPQGTRQPEQLFNNRGIERLFQQFHSVKFFLARDHLREVIVTR